MYAAVDARLRAVRDTFEKSSPDERLRMAWKAYLFAALSVRTRLETHERAYREVVVCFNQPSAVRRPGLVRILRSAGVNYPNQKADAVCQAAKTLPSIVSQFHQSDAELRELIRRNVMGVGLAKSSFMLMLLGRTDVACLDTHMARFLNVSFDKLDGVSNYLRAERKLDRKVEGDFPVGVKQWGWWTHRMGVPDAHAVYFDSLNT